MNVTSVLFLLAALTGQQDPPVVPKGPVEPVPPVAKPVTPPIKQEAPKAQVPEDTAKKPVPEPVVVKGDFEYEFLQSPNCEGRPKGMRVDTIVLHHTEIPTLEKTVERFLTPASHVSAHFVVGRDGKVVQMVKLKDRAWHAGVSVDAQGRKDTNNYSVGIEIVNTGNGRQPFPKVQVAAVKKLVRQIMKACRIKQIVSHKYVAEPQGRKDDPVAYPWDSLKGLKCRFYPLGKPIGPPMPESIILAYNAEKAREQEELQARKGKARSKSAHKSSGDSKPIHKRKT